MLNIFLTIDVETYTGDYDRDIRGYGKGLDYILEKCMEHGVRATFFVEALGATKWGIDNVKEITGWLIDSSTPHWLWF